MLHPIGVEEAIVFRLAAVRKLAPQRSHPLDMPAKVDLLGEQLRARFAIIGGLVGEGPAAFLGKLRSRAQVAHTSSRASLSRRRSSSSLGSFVSNVPVLTSPAGS